jgi:beta-phosphoglucomutase
MEKIMICLYEYFRKVHDGRKYRMGIEKEKRYQKEFRPQLRLIKSLDNFLKQSNEKCIKMTIGTAAIIFNIDFLLDGINIRHYSDVLVSADYI